MLDKVVVETVMIPELVIIFYRETQLGEGSTSNFSWLALWCSFSPVLLRSAEIGTYIKVNYETKTKGYKEVM